MTIALRPALRAAEAAAPPHAAGIVVFSGLSDSQPHWRALERGNALMTPYQRFDFLSAWQDHVGAADGVEPFIVVGFDTVGAPLFLLPLGLRRRAGLRIAEFLGGKHANFNMGLWRRDFSASKDVLATMIAALAGKADALLLHDQPLAWQGGTNPLALLPNIPAPSMGHSGALAADFDALLQQRTNSHARKNLRRKERNLAAAGTVTFERARTPQQVSRVLDAFFEHKRTRMQAQGLPDVFGEPGVRQFIEATTANGCFELYSLSLDDAVIAVQGGLPGHERFSAMVSSIIPERFASESPGEQIIVHLLRSLCARGFATFDLGVGEARYKAMFCDQAEPLFETSVALTPGGSLYVWLARAATAAKRRIKTTPALWSLIGVARRLRGHFARR